MMAQRAFSIGDSYNELKNGRRRQPLNLLSSRIMTEDQKRIEEIVNGETEAWNKGDAEAFATHFAQDGSFTNVVGLHTYGREPYVEQHAKIFGTIYKDSRIIFTIVKCRFVRPDVAIVEIDGVLVGAKELPPGLKAQPDGSLLVRLQQVLTKEGGDWWIVAFHNVAVYPIPPVAAQ